MKKKVDQRKIIIVVTMVLVVVLILGLSIYKVLTKETTNNTYEKAYETLLKKIGKTSKKVLIAKQKERTELIEI